MHRALVLVGALALPVVTEAQQPTDERARVVAVADSALAAITRKDFVALSDLMIDEARTFSVREREGRVVHRSQTRAEQRASTFEGTISERGFDPVVHISGALAVVWLPYDLYRSGQWSHCGVDAFTLLKLDGQWRIATMAWSVEQPPACTAHPAGPPKP